jgi:hypothetical protein
MGQLIMPLAPQKALYWLKNPEAPIQPIAEFSDAALEMF